MYKQKYEDVEDWDNEASQSYQQYQFQSSGDNQKQYQEEENWDNNDSGFQQPPCDQQFCAPPPTQQSQIRSNDSFQQCCPRYEPQQSCQDDGFDNAVTSCDPCNPYVERCDPCETLGPLQMPCDVSCEPRYPCPPLDTCSPMCSPYRRRRYLQPPRRESCKPIIRYQRPSVPMTSDTVYNQSFDCIDPVTAASCRTPPILPSGQLAMPCGDFEKETVTKVERFF